ncbi:MAG: alpha/beta hydrolase [Herpetosiphon sp.]
MPWTATADFGSLFYLQRGRGVPLVCIHGAGGNSRHWGHQITGLNAHTRVIALDLPGHGRSGGSTHDSIGAGADGVLQCLDSLGLSQAILMGHSMGGAIAQWLAIHARQTVLGAVLVSTGARLRVAPEIRAGLETNPDAARHFIVEHSYGRAADARLLRLAAAELDHVDEQLLVSDYAACHAFDVMNIVAQIVCPVLIVTGADDRMTPVKYATWLHAHIAHSTLAVIPEAGHMVMLEQPEAFNTIVGSWLTSLPHS